MQLKVPEVKNCCLCLSLKTGLLLWGFIKLLASAFSAIRMIQMAIDPPKGILPSFGVIMGLFICVYVVDICFSLTFLVATYKLNLKLLKLYFTYSAVVLVMFLVSFIWTEQVELPNIFSSSSGMEMEAVYLEPIGHVIANFFTLALQIYLLILVNSMIEKIKNDKHIAVENGTKVETEATEA